MEKDEASDFESLPPEILVSILRYAGNFSQQRLVCSRLNQFASVLLLQKVINNGRDKISMQARNLQAHVERNSEHMPPEILSQDLKDLEQLHNFTKELEGIEQKVREKNDNLVALSSSNLPEKQLQSLLKLCDLHSEFLSVSAVSQSLRQLLRRNTAPAPNNNNNLADPLRIPHNPLRMPDNPNRRPPPRVFPGEPDPDHFLPVPDDDDDDDGYFGGGGGGVGPFGPVNPFPEFPGQYPGGGGVGGVGGVPMRPQRPMPPGYNPDFERDRDPFGNQRYPNRPPPGPFNPNMPFGGGGGGFGGPRYL